MTIPEIKEKLSIEQVLSHYNLAINRNGHINCPFHSDKKASMRVYSETNTVYCFSANCPTDGKSLDVIDLIMYLEQCTKHQAIMKAKELVGYLPKMDKPISKKELKTSKKLSLTGVFEAFQKSLTKAKKVRDYAKNRGLALEKLELGYSSGLLHHGKESQYLSDLEALNIIRPSATGGYSSFAKGCLIFPLRDAAHKVCSFYGRKIDKEGHYYLKNRKGLYPSYPDPKTTSLVLTESVIDAATLLSINVISSEYTILALYGTNGFTKEHQKAIEQLTDLEEIIILLDGDEAGKKASRKLEKELKKLFSSIEVRKVDLPKDTDVNELWINHKSEALFLDLLKKAENQYLSD